MSKTISTATSVAITFVTTLVLNTSLNLVTSDRGTVSVSRPILIEGKSLVVVSIENYTTDFIQGLAIELPISIPIGAIVADSAVQLSEPQPPHPAGSRLLTISQIPPRLVTRLFVSIPQGAAAFTPRLVNSAASGVRVRHENELESPLKNALLTALIVALIYAAFSAVVAAYARRQVDSLRQDVDKLKAEVETKQTGSDKTREYVDRLQVRLAKQRLLLQARMFDYAKELQFWRNAVTKLLLAKDGDLKTANDVVVAVTEQLGTHGTKGPHQDYESVLVAASWMAQVEREEATLKPRLTERKSVAQPVDE
jgi:cell division protein FtsB